MAYALDDKYEVETDVKPAKAFNAAVEHYDLMREIVKQIALGNDMAAGPRGGVGRYSLAVKDGETTLMFSSETTIRPVASITQNGVSHVPPLHNIPAEHHQACMDDLKSELIRVRNALVFKPA